MNLTDYLHHHFPMRWRIISGVVAWFVFIVWLHFTVNTEKEDRPVIQMGYMPVISNMAAPLLDYASKKQGQIRFRALKYSSFAEMAESLRHGEIDAAFIIAPLSIVLRQQGEDIKVVMIGNRNESTLVTRKGLNIHDVKGLSGKTVAVPMRYSGHNLSIRDSMEKAGLEDKVTVVEMNPPDMASAMATGSLDAYYVGEPFAAQTLKTGHSRLLHNAEKVWPKFYSNLVIVRQAWIDEHPDRMRHLAWGVAHAGRWARDNQERAAKIAARYWNQEVDLVIYAMNTPPGRILYDEYIPKAEEMQYIADLMVHFDLAKSNDISGLIDASYAKAVALKPNPEFSDLLMK